MAILASLRLGIAHVWSDISGLLACSMLDGLCREASTLRLSQRDQGLLDCEARISKEVLGIVRSIEYQKSPSCFNLMNRGRFVIGARKYLVAEEPIPRKIENMAHAQ
jgi:hypothetical protein